MRAAALLLVAAACEPAEPPLYLALGGGGSRDLDRGTFASSDPTVLALTSRDYTAEACPCLCIFGCPGREITVERTALTYTALREGRATIHGTTVEGEELDLDFKVERIRRFEVRAVRADVNEDPGRLVPDGETVMLPAGGRVVLQLHALGESAVPLGTVDDITIETDDPAVATASAGGYSQGWRATLTGVAPGLTTLRVITPWAARDVPLRVP